MANNQKKAIEWAQRAYDQIKSAANCFNLALKMENSGNYEKYEELMEECLNIDPNAHFAAVTYGKYLKEKDIERSQALVKKAYQAYHKQYVDKTLEIDDYIRLIGAAKYLNKDNIAEEVSKKHKELLESDKWYSNENLLVKQEFNQINS